MLNIFIEQQLATSLCYLIYNSKIVTQWQTQHDLQVDQGCPLAKSQPVIQNCSDWIFKQTFNMAQHVYPVLSSVYLFSLFPQRNFQKERLRLSFLTELAFYRSFIQSHTHSEPYLALHELDWQSLGVRVWYLQWSPKRWHTVLCPKPQS